MAPTWGNTKYCVLWRDIAACHLSCQLYSGEMISCTLKMSRKLARWRHGLVFHIGWIVIIVRIWKAATQRRQSYWRLCRRFHVCRGSNWTRVRFLVWRASFVNAAVTKQPEPEACQWGGLGTAVNELSYACGEKTTRNDGPSCIATRDGDCIA